NSTFCCVARLSSAVLLTIGLRSFFSFFVSLAVGEVAKASHLPSSENASGAKAVVSPAGKRHSLPSDMRRTTTSLSPSFGITRCANHSPLLETVGCCTRFQFAMSATSIGRGAVAVVSFAGCGACANAKLTTSKSQIARWIFCFTIASKIRMIPLVQEWLSDGHKRLLTTVSSVKTFPSIPQEDAEMEGEAQNERRTVLIWWEAGFF